SSYLLSSLEHVILAVRSLSCCFFMHCLPPSSTLFPYTTLFRSVYRNGKTLVTRNVVLYFCTNNIEGNRLGFSISKKVGGSVERQDRKSTRLNSSHVKISYAVFCLKKKNQAHEGEEFGISPLTEL